MILRVKKKLNLFDKIALLLNVFAAFALLLSYLAPITDPGKYRVIAIAGLTYPFILLTNFIFIGYWLISSKRFALISAVCILIGFKMIVANFGFHFSTVVQKRSPNDIRIMTYNIRGFIGLTPQSKSVDGILKIINDQHPDVINLEEFAVNVDNNKVIYGSLKKIMTPGYHYFKPYDHTVYDSSGLAIYSRYPIIEKGSVFAGADSVNQAIYVDLKKDDKVFRVYCIHLQSTHFNDGDHAYIRTLTHSGKIVLHEIKSVEDKLQDAFVKRSYQVTVIKAHMNKCPYPYIIAGDFNDTPNSYCVNVIGNGLKNAFIEKGTGMGTTYYGDFPHVRIDYVFTSPQINVLTYNRLAIKLSDHYPIISDLQLK